MSVLHIDRHDRPFQGTMSSLTSEYADDPTVEGEIDKYVRSCEGCGPGEENLESEPEDDDPVVDLPKEDRDPNFDLISIHVRTMAWSPRRKSHERVLQRWRHQQRLASWL